MAHHETRNDDTSAPTEWNKIILERPISYADAVEFAEKIIEFLQKDFDPAWEVSLTGEVNQSNGQIDRITIKERFIDFPEDELHEAAMNALIFDDPIEGQIKTYLVKVLNEKSLQQKVSGMKGRRPRRFHDRNYDGIIYRTTKFLEQAGWQKSENEATYSTTSAFHAIADAMRNLSLRPQSYTGVRDAFYRFANFWHLKRNDP